jgi:hypothetical protein
MSEKDDNNNDDDEESDFLSSDEFEMKSDNDESYEDKQNNEQVIGFAENNNSNNDQNSEIYFEKEDELKTTVGQNRLWNDMCPYDTYPTIKVTYYMVGTGIMNVRKDCYKCNKSFTLNMENTKFIEVPFLK